MQVHLDLQYTDGTSRCGQLLPFDTGARGWQFQACFIRPEKAIRSITVNALLRRTLAGTAWFDDLTVRG